MEAEDDGASTLKNQDLSSLQSDVSVVLAEYGWYLLFLCVGVYVALQHLYKKRAQQEDTTSTGAVADPVSVVRRQEGMEAARKRMQEELDAKAALFLEKQREVEEEKRQQKIEKWDNLKEGKSSKGNTKLTESPEEASTSTALKPKADKKPLRSSGYNPLSGEGSSTCAWRPGRRGPSSGG
ncbi:selenoprotein S [Engraulis encrasicolus]|uniref:selenoprotein S n=1 Tax=Engraulis encrasicolus TaxID=184585 RepID=UPI002FD03EE0